MVELGAASTYAALSGASVGNTVSAGGAPHTTLRGDLGVKANSQPSGFPPGIVTGAVNVGNSAAAAAHASLVAAYSNVAGRTGGTVLAGALTGATIAPGLHAIAGAASNTGTVTLDAGGDPSAVFVFQVNGALAMAAGSHMVLTGGARASRVFWQVNGAGAIGANADFAGTLMALDAVAVGNASVVNGRAFARNGALTLDANDIYSAPPVVTVDGGASAITTDTTPTIAGTTDVEAPAVVTVTVNGQTLTAIPVGGAWSVTSPILANATYPVVASTSDGAGNPGSAHQQLTVDTVLPVATLDGGATVTTGDPTPTIAGTSDVARGTTVLVIVGAQTLLAVVQTAGTWNVTPSALADGTYIVTALVLDLAGNAGTVSQALTVDTIPPALTIAGATAALSNDATPEIAGTADVASGTTVTVAVGNDTLAGVVQADGAWSVTAAHLSDGPHRIVGSTSDAAGNAAGAVQMLTVDTVAPVVTIAGGATTTTHALTPTIGGTSDASPGTTVTVSIASQTMTTLVQANGTWNATPTLIGWGRWLVVASAADPAGNVGSAGQTITIAADTPWPPPDTLDPGGAAPPIDASAVVPQGPPVALPPPGSPVAPEPPSGGSTGNAVATTTVASSSHQKVKRSSLSIAAKVTAPPDGSVLVTARGTVAIKGIRKTMKLTAATRTIAAGRSATLKLRLTGTANGVKAACTKLKVAVSAGKDVAVRITVKLVDVALNTREVERTVKLVR